MARKPPKRKPNERERMAAFRSAAEKELQRFHVTKARLPRRPERLFAHRMRLFMNVLGHLDLKPMERREAKRVYVAHVWLALAHTFWRMGRSTHAFIKPVTKAYQVAAESVGESTSSRLNPKNFGRYSELLGTRMLGIIHRAGQEKKFKELLNLSKEVEDEYVHPERFN